MKLILFLNFLSDPCPGSCGANAVCNVINHRSSCTCLPGHVGDPFTYCYVEQKREPARVEYLDPCNPSPCGQNAVCSSRQGAAACTCIKDYFGDPYVACRPECVTNADCPNDKACRNLHCTDPCPGTCGVNAVCRTLNHSPTCTCFEGYEGDPFSACRLRPPPPKPQVKVDPCNPSPCGPFSQCREQYGSAICSCLSTYIGSPPNCRPECTVNSDCSLTLACKNQKCVPPCPACGTGADCRVISHSAICSCPPGFEGDPFYQCTRIQEPIKIVHEQPKVTVNPCVPSPCGPYSECYASGPNPTCTCKVGYFGYPPQCRPECVTSNDCPNDKACFNERCSDPCPGACGWNTICQVVNHSPICTCESGYEGDAFRGCSRIPVREIKPTPKDPCALCGTNAICENGVCKCRPEYFGDPYVACRPECSINSDCPSNKACRNFKCQDPCPGVCGINAHCTVVNHAPICSCDNGYIGDPFVSCRLRPSPPPPIVKRDPCNPSPCGPFSQCREQYGSAICTCLSSYIGSPPNCRPECVSNSDCPLHLACSQEKCRDPCPGSCGQGALCRVVNHSPVCVCENGYTGDPFVACRIQRVEIPPPITRDPCNPNPCGPNSQCRDVGGSAICSCLPTYFGSPPNCGPECSVNADCPLNRACLRNRCADPCPGSCSSTAICTVINHSPVCSCPEGYSGDGFTYCRIITKVEKTRPCQQASCGDNAVCTEHGESSYKCSCLPNYFGDPYVRCKPVCLVDSDCPNDKYCYNTIRCDDPCPGSCGQNAECKAVYHRAMCTCLPGYTGNPTTYCRRIEIPIVKEPEIVCGLNAEIRVVNGRKTCVCRSEYFGNPLVGCRPECTVDSDCDQTKSCLRLKCVDACSTSVCGHRAICEARNHRPVCKCPPNLTGNPYAQCNEIPVRVEPEPIADPCYPSPCGLNAICTSRPGSRNAVCSCPPNLRYGSPYIECKPECVVNSECPYYQACISQKCQDPCVTNSFEHGSGGYQVCGANALCKTVNHAATCYCPPGLEGNPRVRCETVRIVPKPECERDDDCPTDKTCVNQVCKPACANNPCAVNAECRAFNHRLTCACRPDYTGDPYRQCIPVGCQSSEECPYTEACINRRCQPACLFDKCGINAECRAVAHRAECYCPPRFYGNPRVQCERPQCTTDEECPQHLACENEKCVNPCKCPPSAICNVFNHRPVCTCPAGFTGNPTSNCSPIPTPVQVKYECETDGDCPSRQACIERSCKNPCLHGKPCGVGAECYVHNTLPNRLMTCQCLRGLIGNARVECRQRKSCFLWLFCTFPVHQIIFNMTHLFYIPIRYTEMTRTSIHKIIFANLVLTVFIAGNKSHFSPQHDHYIKKT